MWLLTSPALGFEAALPPQSTQLVIAVGASMDASQVQVQRYERAEVSAPWSAVGAPIAARIGKNGMAWGRGLHGATPTGQRSKREGDWRAPMGTFRIGSAFGDAPAAPENTKWPYRTVTQNDLWVEDAKAKTYNQHIIVPSDRPRTDWEESQRMKMGDAAHRLKIAVEHNYGQQVQAGAGSAIFFHIWRQSGARPTSGCTAMAEANLKDLLKWLSPEGAPVYVLLDQERYRNAKAEGSLP